MSVTPGTLPTAPSAPTPDTPGPVRQRRVRRGFVAAGVLAIALAALGSATLFRALGPESAYLALAADVPAGAELTVADLTVVRLAAPPALSPVPASEREQVQGMYATAPLVAGSLLSRGQLTNTRVPAPGEHLVAVPLPRDRVPGRTLRAGDPVLLVATGGQEEDGPPRTFRGRVHQVATGGGRGSTLVASVLVAEPDGTPVAALAAAGRLGVVVIPEATVPEAEP